MEREVYDALSKAWETVQENCERTSRAMSVYEEQLKSLLGTHCQDQEKMKNVSPLSLVRFQSMLRVQATAAGKGTVYYSKPRSFPLN